MLQNVTEPIYLLHAAQRLHLESEGVLALTACYGFVSIQNPTIYISAYLAWLQKGQKRIPASMTQAVHHASIIIWLNTSHHTLSISVFATLFAVNTCYKQSNTKKEETYEM